MIDPLKEELIPLREAAAIFPRRRKGKKPHVATIYRYIDPGYRGMRLDAMRAGGQLATSREAVARFLRQMTAADTKLPVQSDEDHLEFSAIDEELDSELGAEA